MKLILKLDKGLAAHLRAAAKVGIYGGVEETAVAFIRNELVRWMSPATGGGLREAMLPNLPKRLQRANGYSTTSNRHSQP